MPYTPDNGFKYAGTAVPGQHLTGDMDFYTIRTLVDITPAAFGVATQVSLDALVQTIALRGQPVILGGVSTVLYAAGDTDLPAAATGDTVYVVRFSIEHKDSWSGAAVGLAASLNGVNDFIFTDPTTDNNVAVVINALL